jgi:hypothetical protein
MYQLMYEQIYSSIDSDYYFDDHEYDDDNELKCYRCHYLIIYHISACPDANGTIHVQQIISATAKKQVRVPGVDNLCASARTYIVLTLIVRYNPSNLSPFSSFAYSLLWALINYNNHEIDFRFTPRYNILFDCLFCLYFFLIMFICLSTLRSISSLYNSILRLFIIRSF